MNDFRDLGYIELTIANERPPRDERVVHVHPKRIETITDFPSDDGFERPAKAMVVTFSGTTMQVRETPEEVRRKLACAVRCCI